MRIEYVHASRYGNGAAVAEEFRRDMGARGVAVEVHHVREVTPDAMPAADLYVFSSPGRMGRPIKDMRRGGVHRADPGHVRSCGVRGHPDGD